MSISNIRLFFALIFSGIILFSFNYFSKNPQSLKNLPENIASSLSKIHLPKIDTSSILTLKTNNQINQQQNTNTFFTLPTEAVENRLVEQPKNQIPIQISPTKIPIYIPTKIPTLKPTLKPTNPSKPTPSPTPVAPPQYLRPGKTLEEIFKIAAEYACIPPEVLKAFIAQEAPGVLTWSDERARFYNAYDWWHRVKEKKEVCRGYGWYPETGLIADDSLFAGERCKEPFSSQTANDTVSKSLGACQMLQYEWENIYAKKVKQKLKVEKVDRRVLFDCLLGFGIYLKENTRIEKCKNWGFEDIVRAACVNTGGNCSYYNYCNTICRNYNKFANTHFNCDVNMESLLKPGGFCQFK